MSSSEQRHAYRVAVSAREPVRAELNSERGLTVGDVLDLSRFGCSVRVPLPTSPEVTVGERTTLRLHSRGLTTRPIAAQVSSSTRRERYRRLGLEFVDPDALQATLEPRWLEWFNARRSVRVTLASPMAVAVQVPGQLDDAAGRLVDLSAEGARLEVAAEAGAGLTTDVQVGLEFCLPDRDSPIVLRAFVRSASRAVHERIQVGVAFNPSGSPDFIAEQQRITEFVSQQCPDEIAEPAPLPPAPTIAPSAATL